MEKYFTVGTFLNSKFSAENVFKVIETIFTAILKYPKQIVNQIF